MLPCGDPAVAHALLDAQKYIAVGWHTLQTVTGGTLPHTRWIKKKTEKGRKVVRDRMTLTGTTHTQMKQGPHWWRPPPPTGGFYRPAVASERACTVAALPLLAARRTAPYLSVMKRKKSRHTSSKNVVVLATAAPAAALERRSA